VTPLIQKAVGFMPNPEESMWFDVGPMDRHDGNSIPMDVMLHLPYKRTSIVGRDISKKPFALQLLQGKENVAVAGGSFPDDMKFPFKMHYFEPFSYILDPEEGRLRFYRKKNQAVSNDDVAPIMRFVAAALVKLAGPSTGYRATPKRTFINQKRAKKGKPALSFDWHTVEIVPPEKKNDSQGGTHASPRLHDRRGHWRTCKTGKRVWVRDCKVGDASKGVVFKDYQIGKAL
jgi:hypothetical protein